MLDDDDSRVCPLLNLVDELDGLLACLRIEIGQRLIKEQHLHLIDHHARERDALLLPAGELVRRKAEMGLDAHKRGHAPHGRLHLLLRNAVVFQGKGNVLPYRQADELPVRILQHRADMAGEREDARLRRVDAIDRQRALHLAGKARGNQTVDAAAQRALAAARGARDQDALPGHDIKADIVERRPLLCAVLEAEMGKRDDGLRHKRSPSRLVTAAQRRFLSPAPGIMPKAHEKRKKGRESPALRCLTPCPRSPCRRWSCCRPRTAARR